MKHRPVPKASRPCLRCGLTFESHNPLTKYCSLRCGEIVRGARLAEPLPERQCALEECTVVFRPNRRGTRCCSEKHGKLLCGRERRAAGKEKYVWTDKRRDAWHRRRALKKGASTGRPVKLSEIAERDRWRCGICRKAVSKRLKWPHPLSASLDHMVPLSQTGAQHDPAYVQLAHLGCNSRKGNRGGGEQLLLIG